MRSEARRGGGGAKAWAVHAVMANLLLAGFVAVAQRADAAVDPSPDPSPLPPPPAPVQGWVPQCPNPARAVAVGGPLAGGQGHMLVRWLAGTGGNVSAVLDDGLAPTFQVWRSRDHAAPVLLLAGQRRAMTEAEAASRLGALGGDDATLLLAKAMAVDDTQDGSLLDAIALFERPDLRLAREALATRSWRAAWAFGMAWLDTSLTGNDINHLFHYEVHRLPFQGEPETVVLSEPRAYKGAEHLPPPAQVQALVVTDLVDASQTPLIESVEAGDAWDRTQRLRWDHNTIRITWSLPDQQDCEAAAPAKWGAGYDVYRRHCLAVDAQNVCTDGLEPVGPLNVNPIFPMAPQRECAGAPHAPPVLLADGNCVTNDTAMHVTADAFFTDNSTALVINENYCYSVRQRNLLGLSGLLSAEDCAEALDTTPPAPPGGFHAELVNNQPHLTWIHPKTFPADPVNVSAVDEPIAKYEVWRTAVLRQDLLPSYAGEPADPGQPWEGTFEDRWDHIATVPYPGDDYTDTDPTLAEGQSYWYKVRAFDTAIAHTIADFPGNPSPFTRPLSTGPEDLTPPQTCTLAFGGGCTNILFPSPPIGPVLALPGCITFGSPVNAQYRRVLWFMGDDEAGTNMRLAKVFHNHGQTTYCNDLDLPWNIRLCVKLQGEDAVGNKGPAPVGSLPCRFPRFSFTNPPAPVPVITSVEPVDPADPVEATIAWDVAAEPWLAQLHLLEGSSATPTLRADGCPVDFDLMVVQPGLDKAKRKVVDALPPSADPILVYYTVAAETTAGLFACSAPSAYSPGSVLPKGYHAVHGTSPFLLCRVSYSAAQGGAQMSWGFSKCPEAPSTQDRFIVYRSVRPTSGFVAITPPITDTHYMDKTAPDARYYYQVAWVGKYLDEDGFIEDGEVLAVSNVVQATGPKPDWPDAPPSTLQCPTPQFPVGTTYTHLYFGQGDRRFTMELCYYTHNGVGGKSSIELAQQLLGQAVARAPAALQPVGRQAGQAIQPLADAVAQASSASVPNPAPLTISGKGFVLLEMPGLGTRRYLHDFHDLTVVPAGTHSAKVIAGEVTQADESDEDQDIWPLHTPSGGASFRLNITALTLDPDGGVAVLQLRAPDDVRFYTNPGWSDTLGLGLVALESDLDFTDTVVIPGSPTQCDKATELAFDMTGLPLRVIPQANITFTRTSMTAEGGAAAVAVCTEYLDPYTPQLGNPLQPPRKAPGDERDVDGNDRFLRYEYAGSGALLPGGLAAHIAYGGDVRWVTASPLGFLVEGTGAQVNIVGGTIAGGKINGPVDVEMAYLVGPEIPDWVALPRRKHLDAEFPLGLSIGAGGAMSGGQGTTAQKDIPWFNGAMTMLGVADGAWSLALGRVQTARTVLHGPYSDDHAGKDLMGAPNANLELGLNYRIVHAFAQTTKWECLASAADPVLLDTKVDVYLRQSGLGHEVEATIDPNAPIHTSVRGYDADLVHFHAMYLDSLNDTSDIRIIINLPHPADFTVPLFNVELDGWGCVVRGDAADGLIVKARAWQLRIAPDTGEFRARPEPPDHPQGLPEPACHGQVEVGVEHCQADFPHFGFWILGEADLPHLLDVHPKPEALPPEWSGVRFDEAWKPNGQTLDSFVSAPMLQLDGFPFAASAIRLSKALMFGLFCSGQQCHPIAEEEDDQPSDANPDPALDWEDRWSAGTLAPPPCVGKDNLGGLDRTDRCPPFLRYEGTLALPFWAQSAAPIKVTAFAPGAAVQGPDGQPQDPMPHADYLGIAVAPTFHRGWTEASNVPDMPITLFLAQQPHEPGEFNAAAGEHPPEVAVFAGFADDKPFGGLPATAAAIMDVGTVASTIVPCADAGCEAGDPDVQVLTGMAAGVGVLRATADVLHPDTLGYADLGTGDGSPTSVAAAMGMGTREVPGLATTWGEFTGCGVEETCYLQTRDIMTAQMAAFEGSDVTSGLPDWLKLLQADAGHEGALVEDWDIRIGRMRATVVFTEKAMGDFTFERLEVEVKFDDFSSSNFVTAEQVAFAIDRFGVLTVHGEGISSTVLDLIGPPTIDFDVRMEGDETPRFDGGISVYGVEFGTIEVQYVHGVFGAGEREAADGGGAFMYFGISGQGSDDSSGVTIAVSLLVGSIDDHSKPILRQHGFAELLDYLDSGDTGAGSVLTGVYARAYGQIPIYGSGCMLSINGGAEIGMWYFDVGGSPDVDGFVFGSKARVFATGDLLCMVTIRGDISMWLQITNEGTSAGGEGWVAGGIGFCDSNEWTDWDAHFWDDGWCFICGQHLEFIYDDSKDEFDVEGDVDCG